jgi:tetratricopeptide (TPR) repeat protein
LEQEIAQAQTFIRAGQFDSAVGLCESIVERYPESGAAWAVLGDAYAGTGDWPKAVDFYERALDLNFDRAVMERLAAARRHAIRGDEVPVVAPPIVAPAPARKAWTPTWVIVAVILGILMIPILGILLVRAANGGGAPEPLF